MAEHDAHDTARSVAPPPRVLGRHPGRALAAAFLAVIACFVASTAWTHHATRAIDPAALAIATNASPSIEHLVAARSALRQLEFELDEVVGALHAARVPAWAEVERVRATIDAAVRAYLALPADPRERVLWQAADESVAQLDATIEAVRDATPDDAPPSAQVVHRMVDRVDAAMEALVAYNTRNARRLAGAIGRTEVRATRVAFQLDALSTLVALVAAALALGLQRRYVALLARHRRLAEARADELDQFAARVAHDIKGPLTVVKLSLQSIVGVPDLAARAVTSGERAQRSLNRVVTIVDDLLAFARAATQIERDARTDARVVVESVVDELRPQAASAGVALRVEVRDDGDVTCSVGVFTSLVANLVQNALKYVGAGPTKAITVRLRARDDALCLEVEDNGPGMSAELARTCFEPYVREPGATQPGLGLGLATVKRLVEAHRGTVHVASHPGRGSTFSIALPAVHVRATHAVAVDDRSGLAAS